VLLSAGTYTISILTSCTGKKSCSDDFYIRLDSVASAASSAATSPVPVPGALPALGGGLALLALLRRRRG